MPLVYRPRRTKKAETCAGRGCCRCAVVAAAAKQALDRQTADRCITLSVTEAASLIISIFCLYPSRQRQCAIPRGAHLSSVEPATAESQVYYACIRNASYIHT